MRILLLVADPSLPMGGPTRAAAGLRSLAAALLAQGHVVEAAIAAPLASDACAGLVEAGLEVRPLRLPLREREVDWHLSRANAEIVLERLTPGAPEGATAAAEAGVAHVYLAGEAPQSDEGTARGLAASRGAVAASAAIAGALRTIAGGDFPILVQPDGVDPGFFRDPDRATVSRLAARLRTTPGEFVVGFFGKLAARHDLATLVAAAGLLRRERPARLLLVGDGADRNASLRAAFESQARLTLAGRVPHESVPAHLALCDAVVACPAPGADDPTPCAGTEAMAAGRAVVASVTSPVAAFATDRRDVLLVPPGDATALAAALARLAADPSLRARLGAEARRTVGRRLRWDDVATRVAEFARGTVAGGLGEAQRA